MSISDIEMLELRHLFVLSTAIFHHLSNRFRAENDLQTDLKGSLKLSKDAFCCSLFFFLIIHSSRSSSSSAFNLQTAAKPFSTIVSRRAHACRSLGFPCSDTQYIIMPHALFRAMMMMDAIFCTIYRRIFNAFIGFEMQIRVHASELFPVSAVRHAMENCLKYPPVLPLIARSNSRFLVKQSVV